MKKRMQRTFSVLLAAILLCTGIPAQAWVSDNGDGTFSNPGMYGDYPDNDIIRVGDTYYMSSTSMHLFPSCPIMSSKDLVNWKYESYALSDDSLLKIAGPNTGLELKNSKNVYGLGSWATSLRYSEKLKKFYLLVDMQDSYSKEYAVLCVANSAAGPWTAYRLENNNPDGQLRQNGLYDPGLLFDRDPETGEENGTIYVIHGQGQLFATELEVVDEDTGELKISDDPEKCSQSVYDYKGGSYNEGSHAYKVGDTYYILSTPTWGATGTKKEICIQTKDLLKGPYAVRDIIKTYTNLGENGIHQGGIVDVPQKSGDSEWWSIIFQDHYSLGRVPTLQPVCWETDEEGLEWPMMGVQGQNGEQGVVTMTKPNTGASTEPAKPADSDEFDDSTLGLHWQWNHIANPDKWSLSERPGYMRLYTATVTNSLTWAQNTLRQRVVGPESSAIIKLDIDNMADGDVAGLCVLQTNYNYIGVKNAEGVKTVVINDGGAEMISADIPDDTTSIWFRAATPRFEYRTEFFYSLDGESFIKMGGRYDMYKGQYVGMGFGAFNYATKALGGYVDMDFFHMESPDDHGNYKALGAKIDAQFYDSQSYDYTRGNPSYNYNPRTKYTADDAYTSKLAKNGEAYNLTVGNLCEGDWIQYNRVYFGDGADWLNARISGTADGGSIELHKDSVDGELLATLEVPDTGNLEEFENVFAPMNGNTTGVNKVYLVYRGDVRDACRINWFMLGSGEEPVAPGVPTLSVQRVSNTQMKISWDVIPDALTYDIRYTNGGTEKIISNASSPFTETGIQRVGGLYEVSVRAKNNAGYSDWSKIESISMADPNLIPHSQMSAEATSWETTGAESGYDGFAKNAIDGDPDTFWYAQTKPTKAEPPQDLTIDLGDTYRIDRAEFLPRQDNQFGRVTKYSIFYSTDGNNFNPLVENGTWDSGSAVANTVDFNGVEASYIKLRVFKAEDAYGPKGGAMAEVNVYKEPLAAHTVTFVTDGGSEVVSVTVNHGEAVTKPADPTRSDYYFAGWYSDKELTTAYNFSAAVTADITLYAKWNNSAATFTISDAAVTPGEDASVTVKLNTADTVAAGVLQFSAVDENNNALKIKSIDLGTLQGAKNEGNGKISFGGKNNLEADTTIATLVFETTKDTIPGKYTVSIVPGDDIGVTDADKNEVAINCPGGMITVVENNKGDVNGDKSVTMADTQMVFNFLVGNYNGEGYTNTDGVITKGGDDTFKFIIARADANGDGVVNYKDIVPMLRLIVE